LPEIREDWLQFHRSSVNVASNDAIHTTNQQKLGSSSENIFKNFMTDTIVVPADYSGQAGITPIFLHAAFNNGVPFDELTHDAIARSHASLCYLSRRYLGGSDAVSELALAALQRATRTGAFERSSDPAQAIRQAAKNIARDWARPASKRSSAYRTAATRKLRQAQNESLQSPERSYIDGIDIERMRNKMSDNDRYIVRLYCSGLSWQEIAVRLTEENRSGQVTKGAIQSRLIYRARRLFELNGLKAWTTNAYGSAPSSSSNNSSLPTRIRSAKVAPASQS
jgi:hypothetical protein